MTTPTTVIRKRDTAEALQFTGGIGSARDIGEWLYRGEARQDLEVRYADSIRTGSTMTLRIGDDRYDLNRGDWVIKDGALFSVCKAADFSYNYDIKKES